MSIIATKADIVWRQRFLLTIGLNPGPVDGIEGKKTQAALTRYQEIAAAAKAKHGALDVTSESMLTWVAPEVQAMARQIVRLGSGLGLDVRLSSGMRTYEHQDRLYAQGRTRPGNIVTNARGGSSMHNFARAVDVVMHQAGKPTWAVKLYDHLGAAVQKQLPKAEWGGLWKFTDRPHYQMTGRRTTAQVRALFLAGKRI